MSNSDYILEHFGTKGMRWGHRKGDSKSAQPEKPKGTVRKYWDSNRREVGMMKLTKDIDTIDDQELRKRANRVRNENDMRQIVDGVPKRDSKRRKTLRDEYLDRADMSDEALQQRVNRLRLEDNLRREVVRASRPQREAANMLVQTVSKQALASYTKDGKFSATGDENYDNMLKTALDYSKENKVITEKYGEDLTKNIKKKVLK